jgi:sugar phosphate isomerase/epimerase
MEFARNIGAQYIATVEGPKSEEQRFLNNLERIEKRAEELDIVVCLETGMPGDIIQNANDAQRILKKVNSPYLGLSYDFGNAYYANRGKVNFLDELSKALPLTKLLHFKDVKVEKGNGKLIISNCAPGQGVIDFEAICQFLTQRNETLPITIEITYFCESKNWGPFEIKDYTKPLEEVEVMIKEAVGFLERNLNLDKI